MSAPTQYLTSLTLLAKVGANDADAWQRFVKLYGPLVYSWARNAKVQPADVLDIGQEVFRVVAKKISTFESGRKSGAGFRSWLWGITRLRILEHFRVSSVQEAGQGGTAAHERIQLLEQQQEEPKSINGNTSQQLVLQTAIEILRAESKPTTWQAFWRMAVDGQSAADVGQELGMAPRAVRQAKYRVTRKLRELIEDNQLDFSTIFENSLE